MIKKENLTEEEFDKLLDDFLASCKEDSNTNVSMSDSEPIGDNEPLSDNPTALD